MIIDKIDKYLAGEMTAEENQQLFLFGFIVAKELDIETKI